MRLTTSLLSNVYGALLLGCSGASALGPSDSDWPSAVAPAASKVFQSDATKANARCNVDPALERVAGLALKHVQTAHTLPATGELVELLRAEGSPATMPQAALLQGKGSLLEHVRLSPQSRCGLASAENTLVVIAADNWATLDPMRAHVAPGQYVRFQATLAPGVAAPELYLLDPDGTVRRIGLHVDTDRTVSALVSARQHGRTEVQLMGTLADGPRPILEAFLSTMSENETTPVTASATHAEEGPQYLQTQIERTRGSALVRDPQLDKIAQAHAETMMRTRRLAHNAGDGLPDTRVGSYGVRVGENVAHARSVAAADLGLARSASHRLNRMRKDWTHIGLGVAADEDGSVWVTELYAQRRTP